MPIFDEFVYAIMTDITVTLKTQYNESGMIIIIWNSLKIYLFHRIFFYFQVQLPSPSPEILPPVVCL